MKKKYFFCKLRAMGDAVLSSATLNELKRLEPDSEIHFLLPKQWAPLFANHPSVDRLWVEEKSKNFFTNLWRRMLLLMRLRRERFDVAIALHASKSSARLLRWVGARLRVAHNHNFFKPDYASHLSIPRKNELAPFIERDLKTLEALGLDVNRSAESSLFLGEDEKAWAQKFLFEEARLNKPLLILCLGASRPTKIWPIEKFSQTARLWIEERGGSVVALCSPAEKPLSDKMLEDDFLKTSSQFLVLNALKLRQMMAVLGEAHKVLGNDSGPRHVAAALGRPTLTLYGPQDPFECHPYNLQKHPYLFLEGLSCRPNVDPSGKHFWCGLDECHQEGHRCMQNLSVDDVWQLLKV